MWFALAAASSVLEGLQSLGSSKSGSGQSGGSGGGAFDFLGGSGSTNATANFTPWQPSTSGSVQIAPETMSALISAQSQSGTPSSGMSAKDPLQDLFSQIDGNGDGQISKSEFENALGAGGTNVANADSVFGKLDSNGDGDVSADELGSALKGHRHGHHSQVDGSQGSSGASSSDPQLQALSAMANSSATSSYTLLDQLMQRQTNALSGAAASTTAVSA